MKGLLTNKWFVSQISILLLLDLPIFIIVFVSPEMELKKIMKDLNFNPKSDKHLLKAVATLCKAALTVLHHHLTLNFPQGSHHADQLHLLFL